MLMANLATFSIRHTSMDRKHLTDNTKLAPRIRGCRNVHMITGKRIFPLFFFSFFSIAASILVSSMLQLTYVDGVPGHPRRRAIRS